jgi:hypothetical protein
MNHQRKLNYEAWVRCNEQSQMVYDECMRNESSRKDKEWRCAVEKHQDHVFCMHHEKDKIKEILIKQQLTKED